MRSTLLLVGTWAAFILSIAAAPRAQDHQAEAWPRHAGPMHIAQAPRLPYVRGRSPFAYNGTNTTTVLPPSTTTYVDVYSNGGGASAAPVDIDCPSEGYTSTTTVRVTIYVTEGNPYTALTTRTSSNATLTRAIDLHGYETRRGGEAVYHAPGVTATGGATRQYHHTDTFVYGNNTRGLDTVSSTSVRFWNTTSTTATTAATTSAAYNMTQAPPAVYQASGPPKDCVIDTTIVPVSTATLTMVPSDSSVPTRTVSEGDVATGKPELAARHCGVHGLPVGKYFIARFVDNAPGVPITLEGCFQFCNSVMEATKGCRAYRFYPERGLGTPRCDLYGSSVAYALDNIEDRHPDIWFDLECGSPRSERWAGLPGLARLEDEFGLI